MGAVDGNEPAVVDPLGLARSDAVQYLRGLARTAAFFSAFEFFVNVGPDSFTYDYKTIPSTTSSTTVNEDGEFTMSFDLGGSQLTGKTYGPDVILSMVAYTSSLGQGLPAANNGGRWAWWKTFLKEAVQPWKDDCAKEFAAAFGSGGIVSAVSDNLDGGPGTSPDDLIKQAGTIGAAQYAVNQGLVCPGCSSIYRGILSRPRRRLECS